MRVFIASDDKNLIESIQSISYIAEDKVQIFDEKEGTALDIMSMVCSSNPNLLLIDDDYTRPDSEHLIRSIRRVNRHIRIVFVTSDDSIELGRAITPLDIHYYAIKPFNQNELTDSLQSVFQMTQHS